ncbi:hypothetical protein [Methylobacillus glycogenes]|uniref:hypothetical protein n=1 Tax=Methylobacillus glycogenes TaxID=406 RepID=UPI001901C8E6|nr:hypothetical protein [Methylobacillus glycogenes]
MLNQLSGINTGSQYMPLSVKTAAAPSDYNMVAGQHRSHELSHEPSQVAHAHAGTHIPDHIALNTSPKPCLNLALSMIRKHPIMNPLRMAWCTAHIAISCITAQSF